MELNETVKNALNAWLSASEVDAATKDELRGCSEAELDERFYRELEFGTAGLRGILGAGTNRMNIYVVRRATQGLADYLLGIDGAKERGVAIAYDSRRCSDLFAAETASVLAANGIRTYLFETLHSVPQLSFTLRRLNCIAGVVITASHNPEKYNGYKVYWDYGGQCAPDQAAAIYGKILGVEMFGAKTMPLESAEADGLVTLIGEEEDEAYYTATIGLLNRPALLREKGGLVKIVYTPLHGTGNVPVQTILKRIGFTDVFVVPEQQLPDGAFPTVAAPNPEDPNAFRLAIALAERVGATVCLATDPDADRLGVAAKTKNGEWVTLTGNQIACILLEHLLSEKKHAGTLPANGVVIKSIVSTRLADAIAAAYGASLENVLTGFRFIGEKIDAYARSNEKTYLFGFEESYGFLAGGLARDKDAVCSAMLLAECVCCLAEKGLTLAEQMDIIYNTYGFYKEKVKSYTLEGKAGMEKIAACMEYLYASPVKTVDAFAVTSYEDYRNGISSDAEGQTAPLTLPKTNMVRLLLENGAWIVVRPSGTEPKLKLYIGANAETEAAVEALLDRLFFEIDALLTQKLS